MAASKPTRQYNVKSLLALDCYLETLAYNQGCFPLDLRSSHLKSDCPSKENKSLGVSLVLRMPIKRSPRPTSALPILFL